MSENSQTKSSVQQAAEKIMPGLRTDHGGINMGDILVLILSAVLLLYTGYRSWHFLSSSIDDEFQILALVGLWGIDVGMIFWACVWIFGSSSPGQDGVSMTMWIVDVIAMVLTSVIDTIMYADGSTIPEIVKTIAWYGVPLIIVGNVTMAIIYHFTAPSTKHRRQQRKLDAKLLDERQKGDHEINEITQTANMLKDYSVKKANALLSIANISELSVQLEDLEQQVLGKLNRGGMGHLSGGLGTTFNAQAPSPTQTSEQDIGGLMDRIKGALGKNQEADEQPSTKTPAYLIMSQVKAVMGVAGSNASVFPTPVTADHLWAMEVFLDAANGRQAWLVAAQACQDAGLNTLSSFAVRKHAERLPVGDNGSHPKAVG